MIYIYIYVRYVLEEEVVLEKAVGLRQLKLTIHQLRVFRQNQKKNDAYA